MTKRIWGIIFIGASLIFMSIWLNSDRNFFALIGLVGMLLLFLGAPYCVWLEWKHQVAKVKQEFEDEDYEDETDADDDFEDVDVGLLSILDSDTEKTDSATSKSEFDFAYNFEVSNYVAGFDDRSENAKGVNNMINKKTYRAARWLLLALVHYTWKNLPESDQNIGTILTMVKEDIDCLEQHGDEVPTILDFLLGSHAEVLPDADASRYYRLYLGNIRHGDIDRLDVLRYCRARLLPYSYGFAYEKTVDYPYEYRWVLKSPNFFRSAMLRAMERIIDIQCDVGDLLERQTRSEQQIEPQITVEG